MAHKRDIGGGGAGSMRLNITLKKKVILIKHMNENTKKEISTGLQSPELQMLK